jgi:hypothetical protein
VAEVLARKGVLGRFSVDFVCVKRETGWETTAIEINLRKGGTTHPFLMLQFLTDGVCDPETGLYHTGAGRVRHYCASDNLGDPAYRGLTPDDLVDIAVNNGLHYDAATQTGVMFHLIGALPRNVVPQWGVNGGRRGRRGAPSSWAGAPTAPPPFHPCLLTPDS